jgi:hypothetical protein
MTTEFELSGIAGATIRRRWYRLHEHHPGPLQTGHMFSALVDKHADGLRSVSEWRCVTRALPGPWARP